ncbi:hypothetical protein [Actinoallomurus acaciae]|uniref:Uncharacterized protein n=1 Tax=Actinoallomurus acaciae TaxID=502577 RepID=A0ABV5YFJ5_9ACTN
MTKVIPLRPHRPALVLMSVEWDQARALYVAACERCFETATAHRLDQATEWADGHRCDPELVALLATVLSGTAA